jgi:hypothetical protein
MIVRLDVLLLRFVSSSSSSPSPLKSRRASAPVPALVTLVCSTPPPPKHQTPKHPNTKNKTRYVNQRWTPKQFLKIEHKRSFVCLACIKINVELHRLGYRFPETRHNQVPQDWMALEHLWSAD